MAYGGPAGARSAAGSSTLKRPPADRRALRGVDERVAHEARRLAHHRRRGRRRLGGFSGLESEVSVEWLADAVQAGKIRWGRSRRGRRNGPAGLAAGAAVASRVTRVSGWREDADQPRVERMAGSCLSAGSCARRA